MAAGEVRKGDIGTIFRATIQDGSSAVDVSGATTQEFVFRPPRTASFAITTTFTNTGTDGQIEYATTGADVLDVTGSWDLQANLVLPGGSYRSDIYTFTVHKNL